MRLSDADLRAKTSYFKSRLNEGVSLDSLLVEACAVCREASKRVLDLRHFDVQLIGGMALFDGKYRKCAQGRKTLVAITSLSGSFNRKGCSYCHC